MANAQNFTVSFIIRANRIKGNEAPIFARISLDGKRTEFSVKRTILVKAWSKTAGKVLTSYKEAKEINPYLDRVKKRVLDIYSNLLLEGRYVTGALLKSAFFGKEDNVKTTADLFDYHNSIYQTKLSDNTLRHYRVTQGYFKSFCKAKFKSEAIGIQQIDYHMLIDFDLFLRKKNGRGLTDSMCNNTAMKHFCRLRKMLLMAERLDWIKTNPFKKFRLSYDKTERGYLSAEQLKAIEEKEFPIQRVQLVKDLFIFSCYTGISYIDLHNLTKEQIVKGIDGQLWLSFNRHKTKTSVKLPLLPMAEEILNKYKDNPSTEGTPYVFPRLSNQKMNAYLKEIADLCGITTNLTFHIARHTFATTVTLSNGVPIETVSKVLGHSDIKTTQIYAKVIENKVSGDMMNLRNRLNPQDKNAMKKAE